MLLPATAMVMALAVAADSWVVYEFPDGRTVAPLEETPAVMMAESVLIEPPEGDSLFPPRMRVRCVFHLKNPTDAPLALTVGFPLETHYGSTYHAMPDSAYYAAHSWRNRDLESLDPDSFVPEGLDFRAAVDGRQLPVRFRFQRPDPDRDLLWRPLSAVWDMEIPAGETVRLANSYTTAWSYHSSSPTNVWWLDYVLRSGATWSGPIGSAVVSVTVPERMPRPCMEDTCIAVWLPSPPSAEVSGRTVTWRFSDLEPDFDIGMRVMRSSPEMELSWFGFETMAEDISWTPDSLVPTAIDAQWHYSWQTIPTLTLMRWLRRGVGEQPEVLERLGVEPGRARQLLARETNRLRECAAVVSEAGMDSLVPIFILKRAWTPEDLRRFRSDPDLHRNYLRLLAAMQPCLEGGAPNSVEISSFYRLLGWYWPGWKLDPALSFNPLPPRLAQEALRTAPVPRRE
jgi:hypothetical protein